jgi:hypothetical protein
VRHDSVVWKIFQDDDTKPLKAREIAISFLAVLTIFGSVASIISLVDTFTTH